MDEEPKTSSVTVVVLLGGRLPWYLGDGDVYDPNICGGRVAEAFRVWHQNYKPDAPNSTFILAKQYPHTRDIFRAHFEKMCTSSSPPLSPGIFNTTLLQGPHADIFNGLDTIEETILSRYALELLFPGRQIHLIVVTSDFHAKRTNFLFNSIYSDSIQFIPFGPNHTFVSPSTTTPANQAREATREAKNLEKTAKKFGTTRWFTWYMHTCTRHSHLIGLQALIKFFGPGIVNQPCADSGAYPIHIAASWGWTTEELMQLKTAVSQGNKQITLIEKIKSIQGQGELQRHPLRAGSEAALRVANVGFRNINLDLCRVLVAVYLIRECQANMEIPGQGNFWVGKKTSRQLIKEKPILEMIIQDWMY
jgi:hypothetical protein